MKKTVSEQKSPQGRGLLRGVGRVQLGSLTLADARGSLREAGGPVQGARGAVRANKAMADALLRWYAGAKRDLPWRRTRDPYRIWVSEIMLQQTRVAAVIPYYERFLARFPDVETLAGANEAELLAHWAGLGYYSRARNLQKAAKAIVAAGGFPQSYEGIRALPGIGDYTAAAVASIAFELPYAVLDGNVARVVSRLSAERGNVHATAIKTALRDSAQKWLDRKRPGEFNQAMMELGATICVPRDPKCLVCPVASLCEARRLGIQGELPLKRIRRETIFISRKVSVVIERGRVLLALAEGGFWELPEAVEGTQVARELGRFRHSITHHNYTFQVVEAKWSGEMPKGLSWHRLDRLHEIPLSTTAKKGIRCWREVGDAVPGEGPARV